MDGLEHEKKLYTDWRRHLWKTTIMMILSTTSLLFFLKIKKSSSLVNGKGERKDGERIGGSCLLRHYVTERKWVRRRRSVCGGRDSRMPHHRDLSSHTLVSSWIWCLREKTFIFSVELLGKKLGRVNPLFNWFITSCPCISIESEPILNNDMTLRERLCEDIANWNLNGLCFLIDQSLIFNAR